MGKKLKLYNVIQELKRKKMILFTPLEFRRVFGVSEYAAQWFIKTHTKEGPFVKLRRGLYMLADYPANNYLIANRLYAPSYISFDAALSFQGVIPETVYTVTSATTRITREFKVRNIRFVYHKLKKEAYAGYKSIKYLDSTILIAEPEKALADYLYFVALKKRDLHYERLNLKKIKKDRLLNYVKLFKQPKMIKLTKKKFMLSRENLKEFTKKFQTVEKNVVREYIQHLFLSSLYKAAEAEKLLFKGGTSLKFIYGSPRFSEDLDFTGENIYHYMLIDNLFITALSEIEKQGIKISFKEAKPTTGGYLGIIYYELYDFVEDMKFEISLRRGRKSSKEVITIVNDYAPTYTIVALPRKEIVRGKMAALISRKKPRDYYDLYFFLRHPELHKFVEKTQLKEVLKNLEKERINFKEELSVLLPVSHQMILKEFKSNLIREIKRFIL